MGTAMAEKKKATGKPAAEGGDRFTSTRLYTEDARKLSQLSALRGEDSSAETFHSLFGALLDTSLIEAAERRAAEIRRQKDK